LEARRVRETLSPGTARTIRALVSAAERNLPLSPRQEQAFNEISTILHEIQSIRRGAQRLRTQNPQLVKRFGELAANLSRVINNELFVGGNEQTGYRIETAEEMEVLSRVVEPETDETVAAAQAQVVQQQIPTAERNSQIGATSVATALTVAASYFMPGQAVAPIALVTAVAAGVGEAGDVFIAERENSSWRAALFQAFSRGAISAQATLNALIT
jgi:hypothetical protein